MSAPFSPRGTPREGRGADLVDSAETAFVVIGIGTSPSHCDRAENRLKKYVALKLYSGTSNSLLV